MAVRKDSIFIGEISQDFRNARNVVLQTVIPGRHQSLGATARRRGLFRSIIDHAIGNKKPWNLSNKEWKEFAAMTTMRLNAQVPQFGGFAPGRRVSGRTPKMPIWDIGNPFFEDFTNPPEAPATKVHGLLSVIRKIRQASLNAYFSNKLSTVLTRRVRNKSDELFLGQTVFFISANRKEKGEKRWLGPGIITGRFGCIYDLVRFMGSYLEGIWAICVQLIAYLS